MIALTAEEVAQFRTELARFSEAQAALQEIEDCDGDIEDAAISLALKSDQEPDTNEQWLADFSKRYRHIACQAQYRTPLMNGRLSELISYLTEETDCPTLLATPVALYVHKVGVESFCNSLDNSRIL